MRFISIEEIFKAIWNLLTRFPISILFSIVGTILAIYLMEYEATDKPVQFKIMLCAILGFVLFIVIQLWREVTKQKGIIQGLPFVLGFVFLGLFYWSIQDVYSIKTGIRFFGLLALCLLLVSIIAYTNYKSIQSFWNFNKHLFLRLVEGGVFTLIIFAGVALAIAAIDHLFNVDVDNMVYPKLFFTTLGIFNCWYFLADVPTDFDKELEKPIYIRPLKVFCKYIAIPIITIYFLILYAFCFKIAINWEWPEGWVSQLILWFSILGILVYLLSYYLELDDSSSIGKWYKKYFFVALLPMSIVLMFALYRRYSEYGLTEPRHIVFLLAGLIFSVSVYFNISKKDNIKSIPILLAIFILIGLFTGPLSVLNLSGKHQTEKLINKLYELDLMTEDGQITKSLVKDNALSGEVSPLLNYLIRNDHEALLKPYFKSASSENSGIKHYLEELGLDYAVGFRNREQKYFNFENNTSQSYSLNGYSILQNFSTYQKEMYRDYSLKFNARNIELRNKENDLIDMFTHKDYFQKLSNLNHSDFQADISFLFEGERANILFLPNNISFKKESDGKISNFKGKGNFLIKFK